mmetsp:Transcript_28672/g.51050  ORF Transcript_28672/g.51050 Transcript_28672/m.51050 type:complete len:114 (+) Transcript_28672:1222-1563(+)
MLSVAMAAKLFQYTEVHFLSELVLKILYDIAYESYGDIWVKIVTPPELVTFDGTAPDAYEFCLKVADFIIASNIKPIISYVFAQSMVSCFLPAFKERGLKPGDIVMIQGLGTV